VSPITVYGVAAGGRLAVTDRMGVALRYEWIEANDHIGCFAPSGPFFCGAVGQDAHLQEITGTIDYALTDNLTLKLEGRYDWFTSQRSSDNFFVASSTPRTGGGGDNARFTSEDQVLAIIQAIYKF
jgi:opacity protein-like surface antigen